MGIHQKHLKDIFVSIMLILNLIDIATFIPIDIHMRTLQLWIQLKILSQLFVICQHSLTEFQSIFDKEAL